MRKVCNPDRLLFLFNILKLSDFAKIYLLLSEMELLHSVPVAVAYRPNEWYVKYFFLNLAFTNSKP